MTLDYYYGDQAEQFSFYRIPKVLFTDKRFKDLSAEAKILYGLLLDRMSLSAKNGWLDQEGRVYIVYTVEDIMDALSCASQKAMKLLNELDDKCGLTLTKEMAQSLIQRVYVDGNSNIEIVFRYRDEYKELCTYLEGRQADA